MICFPSLNLQVFSLVIYFFHLIAQVAHEHILQQKRKAGITNDFPAKVTV